MHCQRRGVSGTHYPTALPPSSPSSAFQPIHKRPRSVSPPVLSLYPPLNEAPTSSLRSSLLHRPPDDDCWTLSPPPSPAVTPPAPFGSPPPRSSLGSKLSTTAAAFTPRSPAPHPSPFSSPQARSRQNRSPLSSPVPLSPAAFLPSAKKRNPNPLGGTLDFGAGIVKLETGRLPSPAAMYHLRPGQHNKGLAPQNLRGDPFRRAKVKTELCLHFSRGKACPFGEKCNYAHGEDELKYTTLMDMERAGLADAASFRCLPCFTWVATGACPFGQRCVHIHDTRLTGPKSSWLPHTDVALGNLATTVNVDALYHTRHYMTPPTAAPPAATATARPCPNPMAVRKLQVSQECAVDSLWNSFVLSWPSHMFGYV